MALLKTVLMMNGSYQGLQHITQAMHQMPLTQQYSMIRQENSG